MPKKIAILLLIALSYSCTKRSQSKCGPKTCTTEFASIMVEFVKNGTRFPVKNFTVLNLRTGLNITALSGGVYTGFPPGFYPVATDGNIKEFSTQGDSIRVSGTDTLTHQTKTAIFKIAGGECACHISKISGPEKISFD